jgi:hypothetical protein
VTPRRSVAVRSALAPGAAIAQLNVGRIGNRWHPRHETDGMRPVIVGEISDQGVRLFVRRANSRNALQPMLRGDIVAAPGGSELAGSFGWRPATRALLTAWCGLYGLFVLLVVSHAGSFRSASEVLTALAAFVGFGAFGVGFTALGTRLGRRDERVIRDWLELHLGNHAARLPRE